MTTLRIAVAGAGLIGRAHIARILAEPRMTLIGIIDPSDDAEALAKEHGVVWWQDLATALALAQPDGVVIATPTALHAPHGLLAVAARTPMLMEKPIADTLAGARALVRAAEVAGVPILVGHHRRHSPATAAARALIQSGTLGTIVAVQGSCLLRKPESYFDGPGAWRTQPGGGVVLINLVHVIDDLRNLCGEIASVQAMTSQQTRGFAVEDTAAILFRFEGGALATLIASDASTAPWSWELTSGEDPAYSQTDQNCYWVAGTAGSLAVPQMEWWRHEGDGWMTGMGAARIPVPDGDPLTRQMAHFCEVIGGATPLLDGAGGLRTLAVALAVHEAARTGGAVQMNAFLGAPDA